MEEVTFEEIFENIYQMDKWKDSSSKWNCM